MTRSINIIIYISYDVHVLYKHASISGGSFCLGTLKKSLAQLEDRTGATSPSASDFLCVPWHFSVCNHMSGMAVKWSGECTHPSLLNPEPLFQSVQRKDAKKNGTAISKIYSLSFGF